MERLGLITPTPKRTGPLYTFLPLDFAEFKDKKNFFRGNTDVYKIMFCKPR